MSADVLWISEATGSPSRLLEAAPAACFPPSAAPPGPRSLWPKHAPTPEGAGSPRRPGGASQGRTHKEPHPPAGSRDPRVQLGPFALSPLSAHHGVKAGTGPRAALEGGGQRPSNRQATWGRLHLRCPLPRALPRGHLPLPHLLQLFAKTGLELDKYNCFFLALRLTSRPVYLML